MNAAHVRDSAMVDVQKQDAEKRDREDTNVQMHDAEEILNPCGDLGSISWQEVAEKQHFDEVPKLKWFQENLV